MENRHRVANVSHARRQTNGRRDILSNASYGPTKDAEYSRSVNYSSRLLQQENYLQRSISADNVVIRSRGYKPSDRHDPAKRSFLENLTSKILHFDMEGAETRPINLQKLLTPASDSHELVQSKNKKMFASSYFYAPTHPTVEDQVELARRISHSLSDVKNVKSKGQSMYVNRKKRSVKWIHDGNGIEDEEESIVTVQKDKLPLKCVMNPCGKVLDIHGIQALGEEVNIAPIPKNPEKLFDIVRDLNNQKGRGAEIFAKRRKRSEKWVVDQEQPQTPNTPTAPKTPVYPEKPEINGNAKFMTPSSLTPRTPVSNVDKSFYNPFTVDISVDNTNVPITGTIDRHRSLQCNANQCSHFSEVKKIYLREIAVGTDSDFPLDQSRSSSTVEKSRVAFESANDRANLASNRVIANNNNNNDNNRYINKDNYQPTRKSNFYGQNNNGDKDTRIQKHLESTKRNGHTIDNKIDNERRNGSQTRNVNEETEYTPVPVKQLIQEFEKTCRPVLQYKQISPRIIPIVQQCPLDNGIARFFETRDHATTAYSNAEGRDNAYALRARESQREGSAKPLQARCNGRLLCATHEVYQNVQPRCGGQLYGVHERYEGSAKSQPRCNGYASTDESEYTDLDSDSDSESIAEYRAPEMGPMDRGNSAPSALLNRCDSSEYSFAYEDEDYSNARRRSTTSQELEALLYGNDVDAAGYVNTENEMTPEAKSLMLSMIASREDILETRKHLRNTPVLDNLLGTATPEFKLADVNPELGNKLYENNNYTGPKLSSLHNLTNYNTAPRGWDQSFTIYRPIKFEKPQEIMYSDF